MNLLHMKYALEVAKAGSVNKAAEELLIAQPNLSRAIKELEANVGITIFDRSAKGMFLTPDGEIFVRYAKSVLQQVENIENLFKNRDAGRERFSVSVPRVSSCATAPSRRKRTRPAQLAARTECVTMTMVCPAPLTVPKRRSSSSVEPESSAPVGSSAKSTCGRVMSARATAARCFWPPETS